MFRTFHEILAGRLSPFRTLSLLVANCVWLAGLFLIPAAANATTYTVTNLSDSGTGSLRAAITSANADPGSTIVFQSGLTGTIKLASALPNITVSGSMTITGPGASVLTISGQNQYNLLAIASGTVTISGVTMTNGFVNSGGGYNGEGYGGAIYIDVGATLNLQNSVFSGNTASNAGGGGAICNVGTLNVTNTTFSGNAVLGSSNYGGAIFNGGPLTVSDSTFSGNFASVEGSAILNYAGTPHFGVATISNTTFANNNTAGASAGAIYNFSGATLTVSDSTFSGNLPANGGSIANAGTLTMTDSVFVEPSSGSSQCTTVPPATQCPANPSSPDANGNFDEPNTSLVLSTLGYHGGPTQTLVPLAGSPVICGAAKTGAKDVSGNPLTTDQRGFGLDPSCSTSYVDAGSVQANYLTVTSTADPGSGSCTTTCALRDAITSANTAGHGDIQFANGVTGTITLQSSLPNITGTVDIVGPGSGQLTISGAGTKRILFNNGTLSLSGLTLANGNSSSSSSPAGSAGSGGAILNEGGLSLDSTVFTGNTTGASGNGGAIRNQGGSLTANTTTFSGNSAGSSGDGGAIENEGPLTISNSTFSANIANSGSAIYNNSPGQLSASYSTFSGNNASNSAAIFNNTGATLTAGNDTLSGNTNGGIFSSGSTLSVTNTILAEASECTGGDCPTSGGGNIYAGAGLALAALGNYGGPTQTLLPLPGSSVICAGSASLLPAGATTDQRGFSNQNIGYTGYSATTPCVDAGAVQTNYTAASFNNTSYTGTVNLPGTTPSVIVSVTENGQNIGSVPVTLTFNGTGTATGTSATTVAGTGATFSSLLVNAAGASDSLSVSLPVVSGTTLTAGPETLTIADGAPTTTTASAASATYSTSSQSVTLTATVTLTTGGAPVTSGTVQFTVSGTGGTIGTPPAPATLNGSGQASVSYTIPAGTAGGTYTITATYSDTVGNDSSSDALHSLTIAKATPTVSWSTAPPASAAYNSQFTVVATSNSTGAITYSTSGGCSNVLGVVTMSSGTTACQVSASAAADANYTAGSVGPTSVTASKVAPTVSWSTAPPASAAYNSQFTVVATSNSTGAITYSTSGGCSNVLGVVTMTSGTTACQVSASAAADANYTAGSVGPTSVTASKATPTVSWSTAPPASAAYNSQFTVVATSNSTGAITYSTSGGCSNVLGVVTMTSGTTACQVSASAAADTNYTAGSVGPTSVTASKATPTVSWSTAPPASAAYNSQFTVVATSNSTGAITYSTSGGCSNVLGVVTMSSGTTACQVSASAAADTNYTAGSVGPTSVTASKVAPTVSWSTAPPASAAYNSQFTVVATSNSTGAITYSTSGGCSNVLGVVTMSSGTTACQVSASAAADANYTAGSVGPTSVTASKVAPTVSWSTAPPASAAYNSQFTVVATSNSTGAITYSTSGGCSNVLGVVTMTSGTTACQVSASAAADTNYTAGSVGPTSVTASKATPTVSWSTAPPASAAYNSQFTVVATSNSTGAITYSTSGGCSNVLGVVTMTSGTTACQVSASAAADTNYTAGSVGPTSVTASKATPTVSWSTAPPASAAYNSQFTVVATSNSTGAITYSTSGGCSNVLGVVTMSSGTTACQVSASAAADANYTAGSVGPTSVTASEATPTVSWSTAPPASAAYNSQFTVVATSNSTGAITYSTSGGCSNVLGVVTMTSGTTACQVSASAAADANYTAGSVGPTSVTATTLAQMITFTPPTSPVTFGVSPITLSATSTSGLAVVFTIDPSSTATGTIIGDTLTITSAGALVIDANQAGNVDYQAASQVQNTIVVNPASYIVTVDSDDSGTASNCTPQTTPGQGTDASCNLRDALLESAATGGGNITFDGTAFGTAKTITLANGALTIPSATTIAGATTGSAASLVNLVTVDGNGASAVFTVSSGVTGASVSNLTIQHGSDANGGGIQNAGALTLTADSIANNSATGSGSGGGINNSGTLTLTSTAISGNTAGGAGGGIYNSETLTLSDDTISGNNTSTSGGGIYNTATLVVSDSTLSANTAATASGGGGIDNTGSGTVALANSVLSGNTSNSASDDFDGVAYTDNGGNIIGVVNGTTVNGTAVNLAPLGSYGGPTQTLIPLPGSPAICAGLAASIPSGLITDQRGLPNTNTSYPSYAACVDAGAVQTNYALSFTTQPTGVSVATNFAAAVTLTESDSPFQPAVTIPLALTGSGTLSGGSATTSGGVASYTLQLDTAGSGDDLTANLALNPALIPAVAISATSNTFSVGATTPTVDLNLSSSSISYGTLETFTATVPSAATGSVNFYNNVSTLLGNGTVSGGTATFSTSTLTAGSYSITAVYSGDSNYSSNTSSAQSLTVNPAGQATLTVTEMPTAAQTYGATFTVGTSGGSGTGAITFAATGACSVDANSGLVTMTSGTGTCSVTATKAADTNYNSTTSAAATVNAALANQTALTANVSSPATYNTQQTLTTTGGSGTGAVTYSVGASTACSVSGATLSITSGTGTCSVTATKAADANYDSATSTAATVTVQPADQAALTVNVSSPATYNTQQTLTTTGGSGTGAVTYSVGASTACSVSGATLSITSGTGTCSVTATKAADTNYNSATSTAGTVTVQPANQAALTVNVSSPATYDTQQTLTTTGGSGTGAVTYNVGASTACSVSGATLSITSGTGTCSVTAAKAADANYNSATSTAATVTVQPADQAALTVNVSSPATYNTQQTLTITGGSGTGAVTYSVGASTACSVSGATLSITSGTGTCSVTATKAADTNYNSATSTAGTVTVQPANQAALTVNVSSPATYNTQQTLTTTGGSGTGAVTYSVGASTACSVSGATLSITLGTGTCSVTATKAADANYNSATSTAGTVTVQPANQAALTVNVSSPAAYNTQQTLTTTGGSGTGAVTYSVGASTACSVSGATLSITSGTGTCSVTATKAADANYNSASSSAASVTVQLASQTITFSTSSPVTYGIGPIALSATGGASGNPVTFSLVSGPATLSGSTLTVTGVGTINLTANQAGNANYSAATQVTRSIVVSPAALTVAANSATRAYGVANPTFTGSVTGAVNGDTFTESFSTTATTTSNAGTYNIVPVAAGTNLADYSLTVQNGSLTITQAGTTTSLTVTSGSITPGQSVTLTAQVTSATTGTPTGSVNFYDGTTLLNTAPLSGGTASFTTSTLSAGTTHQLTAVYSGDVNFTTSTTSQSTPIVVAALDFTLTASAPTAQTVNAGSSAIYQVVIAPTYGAYPGTVTFTATGLPAGAVATFNPASILANGGQQTVAVTIQTAATTAALLPGPLSSHTRVPLALALLLLPLIGARRLRGHGKRISRMLCAMLLLLGMATLALSGCGGHTNSTQPVNYTITITGSSGNLQHSTNVTLEVQ